MACEVPVIATRVGGLPEVLRGVDGYVKAVGDASKRHQHYGNRSATLPGQAGTPMVNRDFFSKIVVQYEKLHAPGFKKAFSERKTRDRSPNQSRVPAR